MSYSRRHVTDDGNWSNWNLGKLQKGEGFLARSKGSEGGFDLMSSKD